MTTMMSRPVRRASLRSFVLLTVVCLRIFTNLLEFSRMTPNLDLDRQIFHSKILVTPPPPKPVFATKSRDLLRAINLCMVYNRDCVVIHLYKKNNETHVAFNSGRPLQRSRYVAEHLKTLHISQNMTMAIYLSDKVPPEFIGLPVVTHTANSHSDKLLFPTSELIRCLLTGELDRVLEHCPSKDRSAVSQSQDFNQREPVLYFRGGYRNEFRGEAALLSLRYNEAANISTNSRSASRISKALPRMDVGIVSAIPQELKSKLSRTPTGNWTEKKRYQYLLTLPGGREKNTSSQWRLFQDAIVGGLIVRWAHDKLEYWNYNLARPPTSSMPLFVEFETIDDIPDIIADPFIQSHKSRMAALAQQYACEHLQPERVYRYTQDFVDEYGRRFGSMVDQSGNTTYFDRWVPCVKNGEFALPCTEMEDVQWVFEGNTAGHNVNFTHIHWLKTQRPYLHLTNDVHNGQPKT